MDGGGEELERAAALLAAGLDHGQHCFHEAATGGAYGIVQLSLDDKKVGEPLDLYNAGVIHSGPIALGVHELKAGQHKLTVEILGANPQAKKSYMFGIDRIDVKPAR